MKRKLPKYVSAYFDRHGKERFVYRRGETRRQLQGPYNSPTFKASLEAAKEAGPKPKESRFIPGSFDELISLYYQSPAFLAPSDGRQAISRGIIESFRADYGRDLVSNCKARHVEAFLVAKKKKRMVGKRMVGGAEAARALHKQLKRLFKLAIKLEWVTVNHAEVADSAGGKRGTRHTWTEAQIAQYRHKHPLGSRARLALEIILWTGQRRGDACSFGKQHVAGDVIKWTAGKGGKAMTSLLAPQLRQAIEAMPTVGIKTFLVSEYGKPYTKDGFGNRFREWCIDAGIPDECRAHGLRKAIARRAAELEATQQQLKAVGGWVNDAEVATYVRDADQGRLSTATLTRIIAWEQAEQGGNND